MSTTPVPGIDQLKELPVPVPPFSYFPQTWAWLVLLLVLLALTVIWGIRRWRRWQRDRYRREALARFDALGRDLPALRELPELLKRVALSMPGSPPVAQLGGKAWGDFIAQHSSLPPPEGFAASLSTLAYAPDEQLRALPQAEVGALFTFSRQWIEAHHVAV